MYSKYLSLHVFLLVLFHRYTQRYFDLLLLAFVVFILGVSFHTKLKTKLKSRRKHHHRQPFPRFMADIVHILLLAYTLYLQGREPRTLQQTTASTLFIILYLLCANTERIYGREKIEFTATALAGIVLYLLIFKVHFD